LIHFYKRYFIFENVVDVEINYSIYLQ